ncbi:hypothetical protein [Halomonas mongoliensis]|uniref:hypothetical protein n=1 Tax=Halomonas mongoliensis TaxID=321265 RepID=UPI00403AC84C
MTRANGWRAGLLAALMLGFVQPAAAYPQMIFEREPNDTLDTAQRFRGAARLVGEVAEGDVDKYLWAVDDAEADRLWRLELQMQGEAPLTATLALPPAAAADEPAAGVAAFGEAQERAPEEEASASPQALFALESPPQRPVQRRKPLLVSHGDYLITLSGLSGEYQLTLEPVGEVALHGRADADTPPDELMVAPGRDWAFQLDTDRWSLPLELEEAGEWLWRLAAWGELDTELTIRLVDAEGAPLAEEASGLALAQRWDAQALPEGSQVEIRHPEGQAIGRVMLRLEQAGPVPDPEPEMVAGSLAEAHPLVPDESFEAELLSGERMYFRIPLPAERLIDQAWSIQAEGLGGEMLEACLGDLITEQEACRQGEGEVRFARLQPPPGDYYLAVSLADRRPDPDTLRVSLASDAPPADGEVVEPVDHRDWAMPLGDGMPLTGSMLGERRAYFRLHVADSSDTWRIQAVGEGIDEVLVYRASESGRHYLAGGVTAGLGELEGVGVDNLQLAAGQYIVYIEGGDTDYRLVAETHDPDRQGWEREPNHETGLANELQAGEPLRGNLHHPSRVDWYRFYLPGENGVRIEVTPPDEGSIRPTLYWGDDQIARGGTLDRDDEALVLTGRLPAGEYYLAMNHRSPAGTYAVSYDLASPWGEASGHAMSVAQARAAPFPSDGKLSLAHSELGQEYQWFRLPEGEEPRSITVTRLGPNRLARAPFEIVDENGDALEREAVESERRRSVVDRVEVPAGGPWYLRTTSGRRGDIELEVDDPLLAERHAREQAWQADIEGRLEVAGMMLAAWHGRPQSIDSVLRVENTGEQTHEIPLAAHASHAGWRVEGLEERVTLAPGERRDLTLTWTLPPGLADDQPVALFVHFGGQVAEARLTAVETIAGGGAEDDAAQQALLGRVDLAWSGLGAHFVDPDSGEPLEQAYKRLVDGLGYLIDGLSSAGSYLGFQGEPGEALPPLRLAGEGGEIHALVINQRSGHAPVERWREVEISVGDSPDTLEPLTVLPLEATDGEQIFPLETPVEARYVSVRPLRFWGQLSRRADSGIGQLRVLGEPSAALAEATPDLLAGSRGGHWIYSDPEHRNLHEFTLAARSRFHPSERRMRRGIRHDGEPASLVFGFHQQRAARLERLAWQDDDEWEGLLVDNVRVYTATESPVGPWERQADWRLERDDDLRAELTFDEPVWARYLRLEILEPDAEDERSPRWRRPAQLSAFEADPLGSGESILGYWGQDEQAGPFERALAEPDLPAEVEDTTSSPDAPWALEARISARVHEPGDTRSYRLQVADGENTLAVRLREGLHGRLESRLEGPDGETLVLDWTRQAGGWREGVAIDIAPGDYRLDVTEPRRAIAFLWDASGSLSHHQPSILRAVSRFADGLDPEQEVANLMPLGGPLLMRGWAEDPVKLRRTLAGYEGGFRSSDSEPALQLASRALERLDVEPIIVLITDAELQSREMSVWRDLARVQPRILALEISHNRERSSDETRWYQNLMKSWANVGGGRYAYATDRDDLIRAFETGMRELRQGTTFFIEAESRYQAPPEPGSLQVVSADPEQPAVAGGVVHLIFDASGSMLRRMEGGRRIEVARRIVQQTLDERIPEEVPVALRAYGHTEPHSCETELLVPPRAGNHDEVREVVAGIQAINLARTPLAASIEAVRDDLTGFEEQPRLVVMLTDGEETCDGDVAAAVDELIEEGLDVRLNIVGFHIDEIGLQAEFERFAARGGGEYFDSQDGDELIEGLAQALAATWRVRDGEGAVIARGRVGDAPVELEVGDYELVVETQAGERRRAFTIGANQSKTLEVGRDD